jgi:hypothetical protein
MAVGRWRRRWRPSAATGTVATAALTALTALALTAVTLTTGCAAQGTGPAAVRARPAAVQAAARQILTVRASLSHAAAARAATKPATSAPAHSASDPAASKPPPSGAAGSKRRLVTFVNRMRETIWVAAAPNPSTPLAATGWVLPPGKSVTISTPNNLNTRFWGRTGCVFRNGVGHCQTGDCGGLFQCKGWGTIPATLAEVNFDAWDNLDFYDVSMVDGSNLPMYINITRSSGGTTDKISPNGCVPAGCTKAVQCPSVLDVKAGGKVVACISACARLGGDQYCCRGKYAPRSACDPANWPVDYAAVFKRAEPYAYSYADDDATSVFVCKGVCDYRITFGLTPVTRKT